MVAAECECFAFWGCTAGVAVGLRLEYSYLGQRSSF